MRRGFGATVKDALVGPCTSELSVSSGSTGTTYTSIPGMSVNLKPGKTYRVRVCSRVAADAGGFKMRLSFSSAIVSANGTKETYDDVNGQYDAAALTVGAVTALTLYTSTWSQPVNVTTKFDLVIVTNAATTMTVQGGQTSSNAAVTSFPLGSFVEAIEA